MATGEAAGEEAVAEKVARWLSSGTTSNGEGRGKLFLSLLLLYYL